MEGALPCVLSIDECFGVLAWNWIVSADKIWVKTQPNGGGNDETLIFLCVGAGKVQQKGLILD